MLFQYRRCMSLLGFFHKLLFQFDGSDTGNSTVDIVSIVPLNKADTLDLGPYFDPIAASFDLKVLDDSDAITILKNIAIGIFDDQSFLFGLSCFIFAPLVCTLWTNIKFSVFVSIFASTLWAVW